MRKVMLYGNLPPPNDPHTALIHTDLYTLPSMFHAVTLKSNKLTHTPTRVHIVPIVYYDI